MKKFILLFTYGLFLLPASAFAAPLILQPTLTNGPDDLLTIINTVTNWIFTILLALAVIFIILAAYKYLTSGGGEEVGKAHKMLMYAAIAVAVAVLAKGIVSVAQKLVGVTPATTSQVNTSPPSSGFITTGAPGNYQQIVGAFSGNISVQVCSDGQIPNIEVDGKRYGPTNTIQPSNQHQGAGSYSSVTFGGPPSVAVQECNDGTIPNVIINGTKY